MSASPPAANASGAMSPASSNIAALMSQFQTERSPPPAGGAPRRIDTGAARTTPPISSAPSPSNAASAASAAASASPPNASSSSSKSKDDEIAALKARSNELVNRLEKIEGESVFLRKKAEQAIQKVTQEKDSEINSLKVMFTEISEKRKEAFLQLKEKLKAASEVIQKANAQHLAQEAIISEMNTKYEQSQRLLRDKQSELTEYQTRIKSLESSQSDVYKTTADELQTTKNELREKQNKIEELEQTLENERSKNTTEASREATASSADVRVDDGGAAENGRPIKLVHRYDADTPAQWHRSFCGTSWTPIPGKLAQTASYTPTIDDIGATLKGELLLPAPGGDDPIPVARECGPVGSKRAMVLSIADALKKSEVTFAVDSAYGEKVEKASMKPQIVLHKEKIKLRAAGKTVAKAEWSDQLRIVLDPESVTRFTIRVDASSTPMSYQVANSVDRDLLVQTIRSYNTHMIQLAQQKKIPLVADHVLALAYLIRSGNESRAKETRRRQNSISVSTSAMTAVPQHNRNTSVSVAGSDGSMSTLSAGGHGSYASGSAQVSPAHRSRADSLSVSETPGRKNTGTLSEPTGGAAVGKIKGSNGEELEIDADGFVIRKESERGWGSGSSGGASSGPATRPSKIKTSPAAGGLSNIPGTPNGSASIREGDSDFSDTDDDGGEMKPAFKLTINNEARPRASGADLRKTMLGIGGTGMAALAIDKLKKGGKKEREKEGKDEKKHKKHKKKVEEGEEEPSPSAGSAPASSQTPQPDITRALSEDGLMAAGTASSPAQASPTAASTAAALASASSASAQPAAIQQMSSDDLFAFLDSESAKKSVPTLSNSSGTTPSSPGGAPGGAPVLLSSNSISQSAQASPIATVASSSSSSSSAILPSMGSPALQRTPSTEEQVDILVMETIHARVLEGQVIEYAVWGELLLNPSVQTTQPKAFDFQLYNTDGMSKLTPNTAILSGGQGGAWRASIPAGTDQPLCVLKYKVNTDLAKAKAQVPLTLGIKWSCTKQQTTIDVDYALNQTTNTKLIDLKFLIALQPDGCISACSQAVPKCMWSPQTQKMMWNLANLPALDTQSTSGRLHAELLNGAIESQPAPLSVSFMSDDLESVISGVLVTEGENKKATQPTLPLGRLIYRVKSGIFTVL